MPQLTVKDLYAIIGHKEAVISQLQQENQAFQSMIIQLQKENKTLKEEKES